MTIVKSLKVKNGYPHRVHRKKRKVYQHPNHRKQAVQRKKRLEELYLESLTAE